MNSFLGIDDIQNHLPSEILSGPSKNTFVALNDGACSNIIASTKDVQCEFKLPWKFPKDIKLSFRTVGGKQPTRQQYGFGKLFCLIAHPVFPFWAYKTETKGAGCLIVECHGCCPLSSIMDLNTFNIKANPKNVVVTFLTVSQLRIFLKSLKGDQNVASNVSQSEKAYQQRNDPKGVGMSVLFKMHDGNFSIYGWESEFNSSCISESGNFKKLLVECKEFDDCDYLELNLKNKQIDAFKLTNLSGAVFVDKSKSEMKEQSNLKQCGFCNKQKETMQRCSRCKNIWYCSVDCQRPHWKIHKKICKKI